jgi:hypothetical protein
MGSGTAAHQRFLKQGDRCEYTARTSANVLNDLVVAEAIKAFDGVPGFVPVQDRKNNQKFIAVSQSALLWFKKVDAGRQASNYQTPRAQDIASGQCKLQGMPTNELIVVGYKLSVDQQAIQRVSFSPPFIRKPKWYRDIEPISMPQIQAAPAATDTNIKLRIVPGAKQRRLV